jgi:23S rRNA pseudouridine2605 synthase
MEPLRINRYLADAGLGSRRQTDKLIQEGRVSVNGQILRELGLKIIPSQDVVAVDGREVALTTQTEKLDTLPREALFPSLTVPQSTEPDTTNSANTWLYHKPMGLLCTRDDPMERPTIWTELPHLPPPYQCVGRLDKDSSGLLLITRDGELAQRLMHPSFEVSKIYEVRIRGEWNEQKQLQLAEGVEMLEGGVGKAETLRASFHKYVNVVDLRLLLRRGKKREIRYSLAALNVEVLSLQRVQLGDLKLGELKKGQSRPLNQGDLDLLG